MAIDQKEVRHIAKLARLKLSPEDEVEYADALSKILSYIDQLNVIDTSNVEPTSHAVHLEMLFRPDTVLKPLSTDAVLQNAPSTSQNQFQVPKIVEGS